ncbi:CPBP family intramembrane glutamic endopeptidase [Saccharomonospora piscinae]|uniref:CPBP family intramembrane metalloprotease n=1 Tax=Saccharomonospora piscinae TaxID=687388 RepID=A0A1V8ZYS9_SACPI|nr:type II CAAX endopeptidase family protein [Saccharomonospora piscinae]OQO90085.1 CPBP family intramembrane metalloprotease [Saccharomonospora piscinae]TLW90915.1 CPBP family intramembrane metalloprotease [Saccharomonospora piscinae]
MEQDDGSPSVRDGLVLGAHWGLLAFLASLGLYYGLSLAITGFAFGEHVGTAELPDLGPVIVLAFLPNLLLGLGPVFAARKWGRGVLAEFGLVPTWRDVRIGLACGGFSLLAAFVLNLLLLQVYGDEFLTDSTTDVLRSMTSSVGWLVVAAIVVVVGAPLTEELLFRGALWNGLAHYRVPPWAILVLTALVFAQVHGEPTRTLALLGQGIALGAARMITGRVSASVVAHATNNLPPALLLFGAS